MADNYLEYHREDYERRKTQWLAKQKKSHAPKKRINNPATSKTSAVALTNTINMKNQIATTNAPAAIGPYSQAVEANGTIYVSGQLPIDPATGNFVEGGIKELTRQSLTNIKNILEAAGTDMKHAVKMGVFLADMADFAEMNEVYAEFFEAPFPARSAVAVKTLPKNARVEIECIAVK